MRALGIDAWAAALGHPLELDAAEADYQLEHHQDPGTDDRDPDADLDGALDTATRQFELLEVLCDSPTGRTALQSEAFRRFAVEQIVAATAGPSGCEPTTRASAAQRLVRMGRGMVRRRPRCGRVEPRPRRLRAR